MCSFRMAAHSHARAWDWTVNVMNPRDRREHRVLSGVGTGALSWGDVSSVSHVSAAPLISLFPNIL